jgi:hypothetical protein
MQQVHDFATTEITTMTIWDRLQDAHQLFFNDRNYAFIAKISFILANKRQVASSQSTCKKEQGTTAMLFCSQKLLSPLLFCGQPWHQHHRDLHQAEVLFRIRRHFR